MGQFAQKCVQIRFSKCQVFLSILTISLNIMNQAFLHLSDPKKPTMHAGRWCGGGISFWHDPIIQHEDSGNDRKLDKTFYGNSTLWFCYCNLAKIISDSFIVVLCLSLTRSWVFVEKVQKQIYVY